ncbi:MAG TPA: hydrogenase [Planctomycetes bacterium]|nr:hydrogenase [Planctomycetota bacterium]
MREVAPRLGMEEKPVEPPYGTQVLICVGGGCLASGSQEVSNAMRRALENHGLQDKVRVVETGCLGPCAFGPVAQVQPGGIFYQGLEPKDAEKIVREHLMKGRPVEDLIHKDAATGKGKAEIKDVAFFKAQKKVVLRNCGLIDPLKIEEYIAVDGYFGLARALSEMKPEAVIEEITRSGLRGRGGAGFPTGMKWSLTRRAAGERKYILCNGDEGDPGAFMNRSVLEGDPHSVIEGMTIGGYAIGASEGYAYIRAEYPLAIERFERALAQAREYGLLGKDILGSGFNFDITVCRGSGAFVCGEETALMTSVEGNRGEPRPRPPFPANRGLWNMPSCLNNVETFTNVPAIILKGAEWFSGVGTEKSKGTKTFALAGAVRNTGLVEVPIGTPLGELVFGPGGGISGGKTFKAAQIGGPSGGCIPRELLNVPMDYESLVQYGAIMGSGGLVVMDEDSCMVDVARFFLEFVQDESCGKCPPCRVGTKRMLEIVTRICEGKGEEGDIEKLIELGTRIKDTALCGLGQTAPNPVLSTIRYFRDEYIAHIRDKRCPAGVCPELVRAPCQNACPAGVDVPGFVSLIGEKRYDEALLLHREKNPFVSVCARVCFHPCESKCRRVTIDAPVSIRALKRFMVDREKAARKPEVRAYKENAGRKVAIIGAGPAGLACAYFLARLGYKPEVFEAEKEAGGMLVQAIPAYRLPREALKSEINMLAKMGVRIRTGKRLDRDFTLPQLREEGYQAVFLGVGAPVGAKLGIPGEDAAGVVDALRYLRDFNVNGKAEKGGSVAVIGGGNSAIDAARTALRLGARMVNVIYRRTRDQMPAYAAEVEEAEKEGVGFMFLLAPEEIVVKDGRAAGVRCRKMALGDFDRSGRRRPRDSGEGDIVVDADLVIAAVGQALDAGEALDTVRLALKNSYISVNPLNNQTSVDWIFAGGDAVTGPASVVEAVAAGEKAAAGIDRYLSGADRAFWRKEKEVDTFFDPAADPMSCGRAEVKMLPLSSRRRNFREVELAWNEALALRQAKRCLRCDYREQTYATVKGESHAQAHD